MPKLAQLYPVVKLMDFGMVHDTNPTNERNPHDCTYGWQAPEMLHWGDEFQNPPNPPDLKMDGRLMVWNIGKIVYDGKCHTIPTPDLRRMSDLNDAPLLCCMPLSAYSRRGEYNEPFAFPRPTSLFPSSTVSRPTQS